VAACRRLEDGVRCANTQHRSALELLGFNSQRGALERDTTLPSTKPALDLTPVVRRQVIFQGIGERFWGIARPRKDVPMRTFVGTPSRCKTVGQNGHSTAAY
jgi:hypothetical protein